MDNFKTTKEIGGNRNTPSIKNISVLLRVKISKETAFCEAGTRRSPTNFM